MIILKNGEPFILFEPDEVRAVLKESYPDDPLIWKVTIETENAYHRFDMLKVAGRFNHLSDYHFTHSYDWFSGRDCHAIFDHKITNRHKALYRILK